MSYCPRFQKFPTGPVYVTPAAQRTIPKDEVILGIASHISGDWGELDEYDRRSNDKAIDAGGRIVSVYLTQDGTQFSIVTEADRSATTVLLTGES